MKISTLLLGAAFCTLPLSLSAEEYATAGNGTEYSFETLSAIEGSNVTKTADGAFEVTADVTITAGDKFVLDKGATVKLASDVRIYLQGDAVMDGGDSRTTFTRLDDAATPAGIRSTVGGTFKITNVNFEYAGLNDYSDGGAEISNCSFSLCNGKISNVAAVNCGTTETAYKITNCSFSECAVPAIGTGANTFCDLLIEDCEFFDNNTENANKPQLNLTVGLDKPVIVRGCTITGTGRTMVGGIAVSNLLVGQGTNKVYIENNTISDNRYGITATGPLYIEVRDNILLNNNHDPNPMSGGSGISLAGYSYGQSGIISGNHIEGHLWGITLIQCDDINCGQVDNPDSPGGNVFKDNGNGGKAYDLYNNGQNTVYAQLNTWSVAEQTEELIETVISHKNDDPKLGEVIFMPAASSSAIETISADAAEAEYYNLRGVRVARPISGGVYVVRQGSKVFKALVK